MQVAGCLLFAGWLLNLAGVLPTSIAKGFPEALGVALLVLGAVVVAGGIAGIWRHRRTDRPRRRQLSVRYTVAMALGLAYFVSIAVRDVVVLCQRGRFGSAGLVAAGAALLAAALAVTVSVVLASLRGLRRGE